MDDRDVEVMRAAIGAVNDGGTEGDIESGLPLFDPDVIFEPLRAPVQGAYRGHDGLRDWWADTQETFGSFRIDIDEIHPLGDGRVLAAGRLHVRGKGSGVETDVPTAGIMTVRDGLIVSWKDYGDRKKALEAAGLTE